MRKVAASVFGQISPENTSVFKKLLLNSDLSGECIESIREVVSQCGLMAIEAEFRTWIGHLEIDMRAYCVLRIARVVYDDELDLLIDFAREVLISPLFQSQLVKFIDFLNDRERINRLLDPQNVPNWRVRRIQMACMRYVNLNSDLIYFALAFSSDECALIRNESVHLWKYLFEKNIGIFEGVSQLFGKHWHQRIVLVKVIRQIGVKHFEFSLLEKLANDEVFNVRLAFANALSGDELWRKFFGNSPSDEIRNTELAF